MRAVMRAAVWASAGTWLTLAAGAGTAALGQAGAPAPGAAGSPPAVAPASEPVRVVLPLQRSAYFVGERVPMGATGIGPAKEMLIQAGGVDGPVTLYKGKPGPVMLDTARLSPGAYALSVNGAATGQRIFIVSLLRRSAGSMQDEATPREPQLNPQKKYAPGEAEAAVQAHWDHIDEVYRETGLSASLALGASDMGRADYLDAMARSGSLLLVNPDTRPTSFIPAGNNPAEQESMSQRVMLTAQANGRYPNFGGFCFGWDTAGYAIGARKMLMTYWAWGDKTDPLRNYIDRIDRYVLEEFKRRTGLEPVSDAEYIAYCLALGRPEFAPAIDLPTRLWLDEIASHIKPMDPAARAAFEKRLDAWSNYQMGFYNEIYTAMAGSLRTLDPTLRNTSSVQVDHCAVRVGQYFPSAYAPLDLRYQSTWNDQVGGPDYSYQWLITAGLLDMGRGPQPTWLSNALASAHERARYPGKFTRVAAHGLPLGVSGIGFALEGFSNILGGMNAASNWDNIKGKAGGFDLHAGKDFLDRFAALAVNGRGDHGVAVLFSRSQYARQNAVMGFGTTLYKAIITLTRLGYTPRFITEEELAAGAPKDVKSVLLLGQSFPLQEKAAKGLAAFASAGGRVLVDGSTTIDLPGVAKAERIDFAFPFALPGKPHSWSTPNMARGENDLVLAERWHKELAPAMAKALGDTGRGLFTAEKGVETCVSLSQIDGGRDAKYVVAVNDSSIATQADWYQVRERLKPVGAAPQGVVYDCNQEKRLGTAGQALDCDLTQTTARVFAVLPREIKSVELKATQKAKAGEKVAVSVRFLDPAGKALEAVLPFHLSLRRPDGKTAQEFYRSTDAKGVFAIHLPTGANVPAGEWSVAVRSQLTGEEATLPVTVAAAKERNLAEPVKEPVLVRGRPAVEQALAKGSKLVIPVFDSPNAAAIQVLAEKAKAQLSKRGVEVEVRVKPAVGTYTLSYDPIDAEKAENARVESGELIGRIARKTVNQNDWFAGAGEYRFGKPVLLLDLRLPPPAATPVVGGKPAPPGPVSGDPMALAMDRLGALWPSATAAFPGPDGAVIHGLTWAFAPRQPAVVIQAASLAGLEAGIKALGDLPEDVLAKGVQETRATLWREYHVGGMPAAGKASGLSDKGLKVAAAPRPFAIQFGEATPPAADAVTRPQVKPVEAIAVPAEIKPGQLVPYMLDGPKWVEAGTAGMLIPDLRFSQGLLLVADVKQAGKYRITLDGLFRFTDAKPMWQAQWEDIIELREKIVPKTRRPIEVEVMFAGKSIGKLTPSKTGPATVQLELRSPTGGKPRTAEEECVQQIAGEIELPAGRQEILLVHRNIIDGRIDKVTVGQ